MRYPKEQKEETRRKILEAAGRLFREHGYDGVGVDAIMAEVGLTAGGFYSHFPSKEALFTEVLANAYNARDDSLQASSKDLDNTQFLQNLILGYLSRTHRSMKAEGCIFAALTTDVVRGSEETRANYEGRLRQFLSLIETKLPATETPEHDRAIAVLVQLIGGLLISRAVKDEKLSNEILKACRQAALALSNK
jgi:TetR/AcrR family transcriptional regulator, transcriptional repressor for nem operon